jgi:tetratricopeptide (TPR) repeat protein
VAFEKIGNMQVAQGDFTGAMKSYRDGLAIFERLAQSDPGNADWQRDLSVAIEKLGNLAYRFVLAGDFTQGLDVADEAIARAPATTWLYINRGHALMLLGRVADARALYLRFRGSPKIIDDKSWEICVLDDFTELRQAGLTNSLMDEIETLFASRG